MHQRFLAYIFGIGSAHGNGAAGDTADPARLMVPCKDGRMYGMLVQDLQIAGVSVVRDTVVRFRASDDKVAVADLLVAVGHATDVRTAKHALHSMKYTNDHKIADLSSLEVVYGLLEPVLPTGAEFTRCPVDGTQCMF